MKKTLALLLSCVTVLGLLAGCGGAASSTAAPASAAAPASTAAPASAAAPASTPAPAPAAAKPNGTLLRYTTTEITNLNPYENGDTDAADIISGSGLKPYVSAPNATGDGYIVKGELADGDPVPLNADGTEWEMKIKKNAKWSDGLAITAKDVEYSVKACLDPKIVSRRAASIASNYVTIKNAEAYYLQLGKDKTPVDWADVGVKATDDYTVKLTLDSFATASDIKQHFSQKYNIVVRQDLWEKCLSADGKTTTYGTSNETWMSCGRFILEDFQPGIHFVMKRNPDYVYPEDIKLEGMTIKVIKDSNTALELFLNKELDTVSLSSTAKEQYEDDPRIWNSPADTVQCMIVNIGNTDQNGILMNNTFRKALFHAIDREAVAKLVKGIPANYVLGQKCLSNPDTGSNYRALESSKAILTPNNGYDPALAKQYLETAMKECGLTEVTMHLLYSESSANTRAVVEYLGNALPEVLGSQFKTVLESQSSSVAKDMRKAWAKGENPNTYELTFTGWSTSAVAPWNAMKVYCGWYSGKNEPYADAEFDALWEEANNSRKAKEDNAYRVGLTNQMEKKILDEVITIPMYEIPVYRLISERVTLPVDGYVEGLGWGWMYATIA